MARVALLADIHGNYEAFQAVMRDVDKSAADVIVCLGDLVGYGPDPHKCIDLAFECCSKLILGNHDEAALRGSTHTGLMNPRARSAIEITRSLMSDRHMALLSSLLPHAEVEGVAITHGSFGPNRYDYMYDAPTAARSFGFITARFAAVGHTHIPSLFLAPLARTASPDQIELRPVDGDALALLPDDRRILVNPGSVGQPRDKNPNASWAVLDTGDLTLEIRRVAYDIETVAAKIRKLGLPDFHAERLRVGA